MSFDWKNYTLEQLRTHAVTSYREGGGSRPDVLLLEIDGQQAVLKDHNQMDPKFAFWVGRLLVWRELKALKRLESVAGIPRVLAVPDTRAILMEHIQARQVVNIPNEEYEAKEYLAKLRDLLERMHAAGVGHGDLRSPTNALISENGDAALVDFVASIGRGSKWNIVNRYLFNKMMLVDISAITKLKKRIAPELLNDKDFEASSVAGKKGMLFRKVGQMVRNVSRRLLSKKSQSTKD